MMLVLVKPVHVHGFVCVTRHFVLDLTIEKPLKDSEVPQLQNNDQVQTQRQRE